MRKRTKTSKKREKKKILKKRKRKSKKQKKKKSYFVEEKRRKKEKKRVRRKTKRKKEEKKEITLILLKPPENPIISPRPENDWERWQTFNPGVILLEDKIHFLYRAIGNDGISRLGYACSSDGFKIEERLSEPVYEHSLVNNFSFNYFSFASGGSIGGCEDPRLTRVNNEDTIYMIYTACDQELRLALTSIKVRDFLNRKWRWKKPVFISPPGQIHKNWMIFPEKIKGYYAILHSLNPKISVNYFENLEFDGKTYINSCYMRQPQGSHWKWEGMIRGVGAVPLRVKDGWLIFYHAEDRLDPGKYKAGAMVLDFQDPSKILYYSPKPILEPSQDYENNGFKPGIVYISGAVIKGESLLIYYGGADSYVCVAWANLDEFLAQMKRSIKPKLKRKVLKKRKIKK